MTLSDTLTAAVEQGLLQGSPVGAATLGFFKNENGRENAENVFVLVAHYDFKEDVEDMRRLGNDVDVENLRKTFKVNRNCRFRDWSSPKQEDLLALLANGQLLKKYFASENAEPSAFVFIILSHGDSNGTIFKEKKTGPGPKDYESFNTKKLFAALNQTFPKCFRFALIGPCRGSFYDYVFDPSEENQNSTNNSNTDEHYSSKVSFEPKMDNLVVLYATVETTTARRDAKNGTWIVQGLCEELNEMKEEESVAHFLTAVQSRIHHMSIHDLLYKFGQTPEFKIYPQDKEFKFSYIEREYESVGPSNNIVVDGIGDTSKVDNKQPIIQLNYDWLDPQSKSVLRGKFAVIFSDQKENKEIRALKSDLSENLGFETVIVKIDSAASVKQYFADLVKKSWKGYGCFMAFFFAKIAEQKDGQICIDLDEKKPIGELIQSMLSFKYFDENNELQTSNLNEWVGKPKLFFLIDQKPTHTDTPRMVEKIEFPKATGQSGWLVFILWNRDLRQKLYNIFNGAAIKGERSLQECLGDLLVLSNEVRKEIMPEAMLVSTLPHSLHFPQNFIKPKFEVKIKDTKEKKKLDFDKLIQDGMNVKENRIWLLSSLPGSGKTTVMSEIALELRRRLCGVKVFIISFLKDVLNLLLKKKVAPSLVTVISSATRVDEREIEFLSKEKKIVLVFDGFDEICPFRRDAVLNLLLEAVKREIPIWISTRPHEENAIREKLCDQKKICTAKILPLDYEQQIELLRTTSKRYVGECQSLIENFQRNGSYDILSNPLHLKMIAQIEDSFSGKDSQNLFNIYEKIVQKKIREALLDYAEGTMKYEEARENCEKELQTISLSYLINESVEELKYPRNGIVTLVEGNIVFVHQTFAEFLAAQNYIEFLKEGEFKSDKMPFDLFEKIYRQVRKFVEMKISMEEDEDFAILKSSTELFFMEKITKEMITEILVGENLPTMFSLFEKQISFSKNGSEAKFHFENSNQIFKEACWNNEEIALKLLHLGAFESLQFSEMEEMEEIKEILSGAFKNNFAHLFTALIKECSMHSSKGCVSQNCVGTLLPSETWSLMVRVEDILFFNQRADDARPLHSLIEKWRARANADKMNYAVGEACPARNLINILYENNFFP